MVSMMVIFMYQDEVPRLNTILGSFWVKLALELVDLVDCPHWCGWASSNPLRA